MHEVTKRMGWDSNPRYALNVHKLSRPHMGKHVVRFCIAGAVYAFTARSRRARWVCDVGPSTWEAGAPPAGQEDFPGAGVRYSSVRKSRRTSGSAAAHARRVYSAYTRALSA